MPQNILNANIAKALGIDDLSLGDQAAFLSEVGDVIFETALLRLISQMDEDQQQALDQYVDTEPEPEVLLEHLLEQHSAFKTILEEVAAQFKEDAQAVLDAQPDIAIIDAHADQNQSEQ